MNIADRPFLLYLLEQLEEYGFTNFVLCRGDYGRLEALKSARKQLGERFLVLYGDTFLPLDFSLFVDAWNNSAKPSIRAEYQGVDAGVSGYATYILDHATNLSSLKAQLDSRGLVYKFKVEEKWHQVGDPKGQLEAEEWFTKRDEWKNSRDTTSTAWSRQEPHSIDPALSLAAELLPSMTEWFDN